MQYLLNHIERKIIDFRQPPGWLKAFGQTQSLFIHIPKTAGTSIADFCYGKDPWHYNAIQYQYLSQRYFDSLFKFAFVRNPYTRLASTYQYSFIQAAKHPKSSVKFITEYQSFNEFVQQWLTRENVHNHYFLQPQYRYICDHQYNILVDYLGKFENIAQDILPIKQKLNIAGELPISNRSNSQRIDYSEEIADLVYKVYQKDFEMFGYNPTNY